MKYFIILFLIPLQSSYALITGDQFFTSILEIYESNVVVISSGIEDGIQANDHIKLESNDTTFIARGICLKTKINHSYWKIYRVVNGEMVSKDSTYTLTSLNQSERPKGILSDLDINLKKHFYKDKEVTIIDLQKKRIAKFDLPLDMKKNKFLKQAKKSSFTRFMERNFESKQLANDLSNLSLELYASPYSSSTQYGQHEKNYGFNFHNRGEKLEFFFKYDIADKKYMNLATDEVYQDSSNAIYTELQLTDFFTDFSLLTRYKKKEHKVGEHFFPKNHTEYAILGFRYHVWRKSKKEFIDISFTPMIDKISYSEKSDPANILTREGLRFQYELRLQSSITENLSGMAYVSYAPYFDPKLNKTNYRDTNTHIKTTGSYKLNENIFLDLTFDYKKDQLKAETYQVQPDNLTQSLQFRLELTM